VKDRSSTGREQRAGAERERSAHRKHAICISTGIV
jgi:hypothetical protein